MSSLVRITASGNVATVCPWLPAVLQRPLTATRRRKNPDAARSRRPWIYDSIPLYAFENADTVRTHIGLIPRICAALTLHSIPYEYCECNAPLPKTRCDRVQSLRTLQPEVLAELCSRRCGIVDCATAFGKSFLIVQMCRIYPTLRILIISATSAVVDSLYQRVTKDGGRTVSKCDGTHKVKASADVIICTDRSLHKIPKDWPELILYDEVHECAAAGVSSELAQFTAARRFGFSASPTGRSDKADRITEALFGPVIAKVSYQDAEAAKIISPIRVFRVSCNFDFEDKCKADFAKKRWGYWQNFKRNKIIAASASAFTPETQVLLFVEKVEHGIKLRQRLPEYTLVHGGIAKERWEEFMKHGWVRDEDRHLCQCDEPMIRKAFTENQIKKIICTTRWRQGVDFPALPVVIRADGMTGPIPCTQIVGRLSRLSEEKPFGILIDFRDEFSPWYAGRYEKREEMYIEKGWTIQDWNPEA